MNKYKNTKYDHCESKSTKVVWENIFKYIYEDEFEEIIWWEDGHTKDVEGKIDLSVVLISVKNLNYQIKMKFSHKHEHHVFLNIKTFNNYAENNYDVDFIGFGLTNEGYVIICEYPTLIDFWRNNKHYIEDNLEIKGINDSSYVVFPLSLLREFDIDFIFKEIL